MGMEEQLLAVSPLDGRYAKNTAALGPIVSEYGLIQRRVDVVVNWVRVLGSGILPDLDPLPGQAHEALSALPANFDIEHAKTIKEIESKTDHDMNAVVRWVKEQMRGNDTLQDYLEWTHYGCTSEDVNNLAFASMVRRSRDGVLIPEMDKITEDLGEKAEQYAGMSMLARTHGQPASPTTLGKEFVVFADRLTRQNGHLGSVAIYGKWGGATGSYNALTHAYPEVDWPVISKRFVEAYGFIYNGYTTQIDT